MNADKFFYFVFSKVQDGFGPEVVGAGHNPLFVFLNTETDEAVGMFGSESLQDASILATQGGGVNEVLHMYLSDAGLSDFNRTTGSEVTTAFLMELARAALDRDTSDFEEENEISATILENSEINDEEKLSELMGCHGIWVMSLDSLEIEFDEEQKRLLIDAEAYEDLGAAVNEILVEKSDQTAVFLNS
jgi:hypothetical protein